MPSADRRYFIDLKKGNVALQMEDAFRDIFARKTVAKVKERVNRAVDREIGQIFRHIAVWIYTEEFAQLDPYLPGGWAPYSRGYRKTKLKKVGHLKFFQYGYRPKGRDDPQLMTELYSISPSSVINRIGQTQTVVSANKKKITITVSPRARLRVRGLERDFRGAGMLSDRGLRKLQNRKRKYRALIGPAFAYMLNERIPQLVRRSLARF